MKKRKLATIALASAMMVTSFAACGNSESGTTAAGTTASSTQAASTEAPSTEAKTEAVTEKPVEEAVTPSVDFEDGKFAFVKVNSEKGGADKSELSVGDFNGSKALKVTNVEGKNMFVGINVSALLGDKIGDLAEIRIEMDKEMIRLQKGDEKIKRYKLEIPLRKKVIKDHYNLPGFNDDFY
ncbi:MAG: hypothetical protein IKN79_02290, partial [Eubacterium sp.]|nr:hypothetical protein [Eubacterium sp.]